MSTAHSGKWQEQVQRSSKVTSKQEITTGKKYMLSKPGKIMESCVTDDINEHIV